MNRRSESRGPSPATIPQRKHGLLVLDVDEVVLEFIEPFCRLLEDHGARLHPENFRLTGNVRSISTGAALSGSRLAEITEQLYLEQETRQTLVPGVAAATARLSARADIVFLTAMTPSHYERRRRLLDASGLDFPMIATERSKGAVVSELADRRYGPVIFVDDLPPNLTAVGRSAPTARLLHVMANEVFRQHLPPLPAGCASARDWSEAEAIITGWLDA
ncbi:hypothetical protein [Jiella sonneratiae]|uniref:HAD family hydrolase n=1 Tax=Jiella sonneratiae TaxID=2816856 RepID=A0ABS3IXY2_9HYPH|nr:hypothetical protein [Jiella sonneratiae]MBO0902265.1 hypothetical protein [Jiella sonneratiae]